MNCSHFKFQKLGLAIFFAWSLSSLSLNSFAAGLGMTNANEREYLNNLSIFSESYIEIGIGNNFPHSRSKEFLAPGKKSLSLGYSYNHDDNWMMNLKANFKRFQKEYEFGELAIWSIHHTSSKIIRLYHPLYFMPGVKILYLLPTRKAKIPLLREDRFDLEIGTALVMNFTYIVKKNFLIGLSTSRWRGTKTELLHGIENSLTFSYSFD